MDWIRKNPHLLTLIVVALLALGGSAYVVLSSQNYGQQFEAVTAPFSAPNTKIKDLDYTPLDQTSAELQKPAQWNPIADRDPDHPGFVYPFVPGRYTINKVNKPEKSGAGSHYKDRLTQDPIPDQWFLDHGLDVTDASVPLSDSDSDGFLAEDEWRGNQITGDRKSTDPRDAKSHPPLYTKLFLKQRIPIQFRLRFNASDGEPSKPESMTFQINTLDLRGASEFLKIGDKVRNTNFVLEKFEPKMTTDANGTELDVSILTVRNTETKDVVNLIKNQIVNSPDIYGLFTYLLPKNRPDIKVKKLGQFALVPERDQLYTVVDIADDHATIKTPSGEELKILPMPAWYQP